MTKVGSSPSLDPSLVGAIIDTLGDRRSYEAAVDLITAHSDFAMISVIVYRGRSRPVLLFDTFGDTPYRRGLINYVNVTYVLSPCYQAYMDGIDPGVYRIRELVPAEYPITTSFKNVPAMRSAEEEIGHLTDGWPAKCEEIALLVSLPDGFMADVSLLRPSGGTPISDNDVAVVKFLAPVLSAVIRHNWSSCAREAPQPKVDSAKCAFDEFGQGVLSLREMEVVRLILQGHSSLSISLRLGISNTTVKSHRKNAYAKLNISTQSELLAKFLGSLQSRE